MMTDSRASDDCSATDADNLPVLTPRHRRFVDEYCYDFNATRAAVAVGFVAAHATQEGYRLLQRADITTHVQARIGVLREQVDIKREQIAEVLADIGLRFDVSHVVGVDPRSLPPEVARCVQEVKVTRHMDGSVSYKYKLHDRVRAIEALSKLLGLNAPDKLEVQTPQALPTERGEWRDGLADAELIAWGVARSSGNGVEAARLERIGAERVAAVVSRHIAEKEIRR